MSDQTLIGALTSRTNLAATIQLHIAARTGLPVDPNQGVPTAKAVAFNTILSAQLAQMDTSTLNMLAAELGESLEISPQAKPPAQRGLPHDVWPPTEPHG